MTSRLDLITSIVQTTADYRAEEQQFISPEHVEKWVSQFDDAEAELAMLHELDHVLKQTYFSRDRVMQFLSDLADNTRLTGHDPATFWKGTNFLDIQQNGHSQHEMLVLFDEVLKSKFKITSKDCQSEEARFVYLDDVLFSGNRIFQDLSAWIQKEALSDENPAIGPPVPNSLPPSPVPSGFAPVHTNVANCAVSVLFIGAANDPLHNPPAFTERSFATFVPFARYIGVVCNPVMLFLALTAAVEAMAYQLTIVSLNMAPPAWVFTNVL